MKTIIATILLTGGLAMAHAHTVLSPENQARSESLFTVPPGMSRIVILRPEDRVALIGTPVKIDGEPLEATIGKSLLFKDVLPGKHKVTAYAQLMKTIEVDVKAGETVYIQQLQTFGRLQRHARLAQLQPAEGQREAWGRSER